MNNEQNTVNLFVKIILYLLLAFAFFSNYYVEKNIIGTGAIVIFIFAIFSLIALTIVYNKKCSIYWAYVSISPFILIILFNLILLYYNALGIETNFVTGIPKFFWELMNAESITAILAILIILIILGLFKIKISFRFRD